MDTWRFSKATTPSIQLYKFSTSLASEEGGQSFEKKMYYLHTCLHVVCFVHLQNVCHTYMYMYRYHHFLQKFGPRGPWHIARMNKTSRNHYQWSSMHQVPYQLENGKKNPRKGVMHVHWTGVRTCIHLPLCTCMHTLWKWLQEPFGP